MTKNNNFLLLYHAKLKSYTKWYNISENKTQLTQNDQEDDTNTHWSKDFHIDILLVKILKNDLNKILTSNAQYM